MGWWLGEEGTVQLQPKLVGSDADLGWALDLTIMAAAPCLDELAMPAA